MRIATSIIGVKPGCHGVPNHRSCPNSSSQRKSTPMSSSGGTVLGWPPVPRSCATARRTGPPPSDSGRASRHTPATRQATASASTHEFHREPMVYRYQLLALSMGCHQTCTNP